ncbi:Uncharacterised protein [Staphylococcus gallinarum]|uniref:Uncharacterized protein n=1 Tax=Staphylococcus gallinarum TaxID=1293 RepID=A0A380FN71_STAGA|nr:Uncharacterised protein [Staphylococcus gallinarum]
MIPINTPRIVEIINCSMASNAENAPVTKAATAILKDMIPAAFNLVRIHLLKLKWLPLGNTFPLVIACTATASVGQRIAANGKGSRHW